MADGQSTTSQGSSDSSSVPVNEGTPEKDKHCMECFCEELKPSCMVCFSIQYTCEGTCDCCEESRQQQALMMSQGSSDSSSVPGNEVTSEKERYCKECCCEKQQPSCMVCAKIQYTCEGTCDCCKEYRRQLEVALMRSLGSSDLNSVPGNEVTSEEERYCKECCCEKDQPSCMVCAQILYTCEGTCDCCKESGEQQAFALNRSQESSDSSYVHVDEVTPEKERYCKECLCEEKKRNRYCLVCLTIEFTCEGTCYCCEEYREQVALALMRDSLKENE